VGVVADLAEYLPSPRVRRCEEGAASGDPDAADAGPTYELYDPPSSIGKVHGFHGNWLVLLKAYAYIARLGDEGLADTSAKAVLNANYLASEIDFEVPYGPFHHEFAATAGDRDAADVAKRMLDHGVHPPTTKWPEFVPEAMLTEPTEGETRSSLDDLADAFNAVAREDEATVADAPHRTTARRIDQADAARNPRLSWHALDDG
jgi:glycine dehydrogenase subunit 2